MIIKSKLRLSLLLILMLSLLLIVFTGCKKTIYHWNIEKSIDEIASIEIVNIDSESSRITEIVCEIDQEFYKEMIDDIESLDITKYGWNLCPPFGMSVKITFNDGNVDIISLWESRHVGVMETDKVGGYISWLHIDSNQYDAFIKKWLNIAQADNS